MPDRDLEAMARLAMALWEANPKRQALARLLNIQPSQVTDEMIRQVERGLNFRGPNIQQIPRTPRKP